MAVDPTKANSLLAVRIHTARNHAEQFIDQEAERIKREDAPNVPVTTLRQMIMAKHQCACSAALGLIEEKEKEKACPINTEASSEPIAPKTVNWTRL